MNKNNSAGVEDTKGFVKVSDDQILSMTTDSLVFNLFKYSKSHRSISMGFLVFICLFAFVELCWKIGAYVLFAALRIYLRIYP